MKLVIHTAKKNPPVILRGLDQPHKEYVSYEEEGLFVIKVMEFPGAW